MAAPAEDDEDRFQDDDDYTPDPWQEAMDECGLDSTGACGLAGSEHCDFECPFNGADVDDD